MIMNMNMKLTISMNDKHRVNMKIGLTICITMRIKVIRSIGLSKRVICFINWPNNKTDYLDNWH